MDNHLIYFIGFLLVALQTAVFFILGGLRKDIHDNIKRMDEHAQNYNLHCVPQLKQKLIDMIQLPNNK